MQVPTGSSQEQFSSPLLSSAFNRTLKRAFDLLAASTGLVLLLPLGVIVALAIKLTSPGPILYTAMRIARNGTPFTLYKFRTMHISKGKSGPGITRKNDPRITRIGSWLRKTKLDEIPQLINILRGDMSLVGPRPEDPRYVDTYTPAQRVVLAVRPGLTGLASIRYRDEAALLVGQDWEKIYVERLMPDKLRIDRIYLERWSFGLDLRILFYTVFVPSGVTEDGLL